jgi:hypothetical protein
VSRWDTRRKPIRNPHLVDRRAVKTFKKDRFGVKREYGTGGFPGFPLVASRGIRVE